MRCQFVKGSGRGLAPKRWARRRGRHSIAYLEKFNSATREKINELLIDELPETLSNEEKIRKITTWMTTLRKLGKIENIGTDHDSHWILSGSNVKSNVESGAMSTKTLENKDIKSR